VLLEIAALLVVSGFLLLIIGIFIARQFTLRAKLATAFLVIVLTSLAVLAVLDSYIMSENLTDGANNVLSSSARHYAERIDNFNRQNLKFIKTEANLPAIIDFIKLNAEPPYDRQTMLEILRALKSRQDKIILSYAILDTQGINILDTVQDNTGIDESQQKYYKALTAKKNVGSYHSPLIFEEQKPVIIFSSKINDLSGKFIGILRAKYDASILFSLVGRIKGMVGRGSFAVLLDENYLRLVHGRRNEFKYTLASTLDKATLKQLKKDKRVPKNVTNNYTERAEWLKKVKSASTSDPIIETQFYGLGTVLFSSAVVKLETAPWKIIVSLPQDVFLAPVFAQTESALLLVAIIVAWQAHSMK
jgi:hypothetical protein